MTLLTVENLTLEFDTDEGTVRAVDQVSFEVEAGKTLGVVGESGCGKSTVALGVMQDLGKNGRVVGGSIKFKGRDLSQMSDEELRDIRGNEIAMIYQEPMASLNPARQLGLGDHVGRLVPGYDADLMAVDAEGNVVLTMVGGEIVHLPEWSWRQ